MTTAKPILDRLVRATFVTCLAVVSFGVVGASAQTRAALVRDTDNAALAPFSTCADIALTNGSGSAAFLNVPAGKRFVLQHMSYFAAVTSGSLLAQGFVNSPTVTRFFIPVNPPHAANIAYPAGSLAQDASFPITAYFEAGETPTIYLSLSGTASARVDVCVAGFYVTP